jgi:NHL repeat
VKRYRFSLLVLLAASIPGCNGSSGPAIQVLKPDLLAEWGTPGSGPGQLGQAVAIAASRNEVYVADSGNHRVEAFDPDGRFLREWGSAGGEEGQFHDLIDIAAADGYVYTLEFNPTRVQRWDPDGTLLNSWVVLGDCCAGAPNTRLGPAFLVTSGRGVGHVYVAYTIATLGRVTTHVKRFNEVGEEISEFDLIYLDDFAASQVGSLYLVNGSQISAVDPSGTVSTSWQVDGLGLPILAAVDFYGYVLTTSPGLARTAVYDSFGNFEAWLNLGWEDLAGRPSAFELFTLLNNRVRRYHDPVNPVDRQPGG